MKADQIRFRCVQAQCCERPWQRPTHGQASGMAAGEDRTEKVKVGRGVLEWQCLAAAMEEAWV
jgi:hypothetical protein